MYCLYRPPPLLQGEGLKRFTEYLKLVVGAQARAAYSGLEAQLEGPQAAKAGAKADFAAALTALFKVRLGGGGWLAGWLDGAWWAPGARRRASPLCVRAFL